MLNLNQAVARHARHGSRTLGEDVALQHRPCPRGSGIAASIPARCEVALLNVLINARDAMPAGRCVVIATETATIVGPRTWPGSPACRPAAMP